MASFMDHVGKTGAGAAMPTGLPVRSRTALSAAEPMRARPGQANRAATVPRRTAMPANNENGERHDQ